MSRKQRIGSIVDEAAVASDVKINYDNTLYRDTRTKAHVGGLISSIRELEKVWGAERETLRDVIDELRDDIATSKDQVVTLKAELATRVMRDRLNAVDMSDADRAMVLEPLVTVAQLD